jgi:hypothetical protein
MKRGTNARIYLYLGCVSENGVSTSNSPLTQSGPKVELYTRTESVSEGTLTEWRIDENGGTYVDVENIQEDQIYAIWVYDNNGNKVGHGRQIISCLEVPQQDTMSLKSSVPFVRVNEGAIVNVGKLVGDPVQISIEHRVGNNITNTTIIPDGCYLTVNDVAIPVLTAGCNIDFNAEAFSYLYENLEPICIKLFRDDVLTDILTIEKTVVYPDPIIYPAGEFDRSKSFMMNFNQIPYVYVQTEDSIEYYVGNKSILEKYYRTEINLNGSVLATGGTDPRDLCTEEGDLL